MSNHFLTLRRACAAVTVAAILACAAGAAADQFQVKVKNDTKEKATDLHIVWEKGEKVGPAPGFKGAGDQDPAGTFGEASGSSKQSQSWAVGGNGTGIPAGGELVLSFDIDPNKDRPVIKSITLTKNGKLTYNPDPKAGDVLKNCRRDKNEETWAMAPATGDGKLAVLIAGQAPAIFQPAPGADGVATAQAFAAFVGAQQYGQVLEVQAGTAMVTSTSFDTQLPNIVVQVVQQDSTQPVDVKVLGDYRPDFEQPMFTGQPNGAPISGRDGWYTPNNPPSSEGRVFTYAGNIAGVVTNQFGSQQFLGVASMQLDGRAEHAVTVTADHLQKFTYDVNRRYLGQPGNLNPIAGSFSLQPIDTSRSFAQVDVWKDLQNGMIWSARYGVADGTPGSPIKTGLQDLRLAGPQWDNLQANHWYELSTTVDLAQNRIVEVSIRDITSGNMTTVQPADWYLDGGSQPNKPLASAERFFCGNNPGSFAAYDNFVSADVTPSAPDCYPDCDGSGGLDIDDFICFQMNFATGDNAADCDGSGELDVDDYICFQTQFGIGCQ